MSGDELAQEKNYREPCYVEFAYGTFLNESISEDTQELKERETERQSCAYPSAKVTALPGADYPITEVVPVSAGDAFLDYPETEIVPIPAAGDLLALDDSFVEPCGADYALGTWLNELVSEPTQIIKASRAHLECVEPEPPEVGGWVRFTTPQFTCSTACFYNAGEDAFYSSGPAFPLPGMRVRVSYPFHQSFRPTKFRVQSRDDAYDSWDWKLLDDAENEISVVTVNFPNNPQPFPGEDAISNEAEIDFDTYGNDLYYIEAQRDSSGSLRDIWFFVPVDPDWLYMVPNAKHSGDFGDDDWEKLANGIEGGTPDDNTNIVFTPSDTYIVRLSELSWEGGLVNCSALTVRIRIKTSGGSDNFRILTFWQGTTPDNNWEISVSNTDFETKSATFAETFDVSDLAGARLLLDNLSGTQTMTVSELEVELVP